MAIFLGVLSGVVVAILILVLIIYLWIRSLLDRNGFRGQTLESLYRKSKHEAMLDKSRVKQVSGMTSVLLPTIKTYFKDFDEKEMYLLTETSIRKILSAIESRSEKALNDNDLSLIAPKLILQVRNLNKDDVIYKYHDIVFHDHAIRDFKKDSGKASIVISSSLEYYYEELKGDKVIKKDDYKKQTRYQTEFVYIYDAKKAGYDIKAIGLNCPNCGSPLKGFGETRCSYCKSGINISTLDFKKTFKIVNIKEDY